MASNVQKPLKLEDLISAAVEAYTFKQWSEGKATYPMYGIAHADETVPGKSVFLQITDSGLKPYRLTPLEDLQTGKEASTSPESKPSQLAETSSLPQDWRFRVKDGCATIATRLDALREWFEQNEAEAVSYLAAELVRDGVNDDWRTELVFVAEEAHFADPAMQRTVCERLFEIAASLRTGQEAGSDKVVWSALRRAATLVGPAELDKLLPFLEAGPGIDTRLVALRAVFHIFEATPPIVEAQPQAIRDRIAIVARKFLDPDIFSGGENAAIAEHAVLALAAMGDSRFPMYLKQAKLLRRRWLNRQLQEFLARLLQSWKLASADFVSNPIYVLVERERATMT